jgi:hypothetical protein
MRYSSAILFCKERLKHEKVVGCPASFFTCLFLFEYFINEFKVDDGSSKHLWNFGQFLPDYTVQHPRRHSPP